jgi:hypothetical protein
MDDYFYPFQRKKSIEAGTSPGSKDREEKLVVRPAFTGGPPWKRKETI